jgi:hypothetical protein
MRGVIESARLVGVVGCLTAGLVTGPGGPAVAQDGAAEACSWAVEALPVLPGGRSAEIDGVDPSGRFWSGSATDADSRSHAVIWQAGQIIDLGTSPGGVAIARDVNGRGTAVGVFADAGSTARPALWRDGQLIALAMPADAVGGSALGVNNAGLIVGFVDFIGAKHAAFWWDRAPDRVTDLGAGGLQFAQLEGVSETGVLAGQTDGQDQTGAQLKQALTGTVRGGLRTLPGTVAGTLTTASSAAGPYVAGSELPLPGTGAGGGPIRWTFGHPQPLSTDKSAFALAVNHRGQVVGFTSNGSVVWRDGLQMPLPALDGGTAFGAVTIADDGRVGGSQFTRTGVVPLIWTCG